jgi:hypothetical protein
MLLFLTGIYGSTISLAKVLEDGGVLFPRVKTRALFDTKYPEAMWLTTSSRAVIAKASGSFSSLQKNVTR